MKVYTSKKLSRERGFVEISFNMVLIAVAILGGAGLLMGFKLVGDAKAEALSSGHRQIVDTLRSSYRNAASFAGLSNTQAVTLKVAPKTWMSGASAIANNMGGTVTITPATINSSNDGFQVAHALLNEHNCNNFVNAIFPDAVTITVGSTQVKASNTSNITVATLGTACSNASNTVTAVYGKY
jgi:hypothetical protein